MKFNMIQKKGAGALFVLKPLMLSGLLIGVLFGVTGCSAFKEPVQVVLTTGFSKDEVFRIESRACTRSEILIYLTNIQNRYENTYGNQIWEIDTGEESLEGNIKETVLYRLAQLKVMVLMAEKYEVALTDDEKELARNAGEEYFESLSQNEIRALEATKSGIISMYEDYALADKVYRYIIKDINPEISDDEARIITIQQILLKTTVIDDDGNEVPMEASQVNELWKQADEIRNQALAGEDFETLISKYNQGETGTLSFGKGDTNLIYEKEAFRLEKDEISDILETDEGFCIIKCISTFNREETDINKEKIIKSRRRQVFGEEYSAFADTLTRIFNEDVWEEISLVHDEDVKTDSFFSTYNKYFEETGK